MNYSELVTEIPDESREAYDARKMSARVLDEIYPTWERLNISWRDLLKTASLRNRRVTDFHRCPEIATSTTSAVSGMTLLISDLALFTLWHSPRYSRSHLRAPQKLRPTDLPSDNHPRVTSARSRIGAARTALQNIPPSELTGLDHAVWLSGYAILNDLDRLLTTITNEPTYLDYVPGWAKNDD